MKADVFEYEGEGIQCVYDNKKWVVCIKTGSLIMILRRFSIWKCITQPMSSLFWFREKQFF